MTFLVKIVNGELDFGSEYNLARFHDFAKQNEGKYLRLEKPELKRSQQQNRFYWFYLGIISRETGNDEEELHEFFRAKFLPKKFAVIKGKTNAHEVQIRMSTTKLTKAEFGEYLDKISSLTEIPIPVPTLLEGYLPR